MDTAQIVMTLLGAGTLGAILTSIVNGTIKHVSGTAGRERTRNADMRTQRNEAWADAERERDARERADRNKGRALDYAAQCRRKLIEAQCVDAAEIPPWPTLESEPPQATPPGGSLF